LAAALSERLGALARTHEEKLRFLVVGVWNTLFSTGVLWVLEHAIPHDPNSILAKQLILTLVWVIAVTQNFFTFKLLVFRTKGNWLREYMRMYVTYSATFVVQSVLVQSISAYFHASLFIANIPVIFIVTILSYMGHKYFTFRGSSEEAEAAAVVDADIVEDDGPLMPASAPTADVDDVPGPTETAAFPGPTEDS
jgi:putative flippase GtrA